MLGCESARGGQPTAWEACLEERTRRQSWRSCGPQEIVKHTEESRAPGGLTRSPGNRRGVGKVLSADIAQEMSCAQGQGGCQRFQLQTLCLVQCLADSRQARTLLPDTLQN